MDENLRFVMLFARLCGRVDWWNPLAEMTPYEWSTMKKME